MRQMRIRQFTAFAFLMTLALQPSPQAPTLHDIDNADGDGTYTVSWSYTSPLVEGYTLQEATDADFTSPDEYNLDGNTTSYTISGKGNGTYYYRVRAEEPLGSSEWSNVESVTVGSSASHYAYLPLVLGSQESPSGPVTPNDTRYSEYQWNLPQIEAPYAWAISTGSSDVIVAVLDTGVDLDHPDLQGNVTSGHDFVNDDSDPSDDEGHGTHVAGIAAAVTNNNRGVAGVSWNSKIMPVKVLNWQGWGYYSDIADGIRWAANNGADVINLSLGGESGSTTLENAINHAHDQGVLVVASAGNSYEEGNPVIYPAAYEHVVAVAATGDQDEHARYSETGSYVDVAAPGGNPSGSWDSNPNHWIMSTYLGGSGYAQVAGTSQAAPHVAGLAALVWSVNPSLDHGQVEQVIEQTAVDLGNPGRDDVFGHGRIDAHSALSSASSGALAAAPTKGAVSSSAAHSSISPPSRVPVRGTESTEAEFKAGVVLVKFRAGVHEETISSVLGKYPIQSTDRIPALGVLRLSVPEGREMEISQRLGQDLAVEYAEPDYVARAF